LVFVGRKDGWKEEGRAFVVGDEKERERMKSMASKGRSCPLEAPGENKNEPKLLFGTA
jgi:hypothetical protein